MKKNKLIFASILAFSAVCCSLIATIAVKTSLLNLHAEKAECSYHHGYHYERKDPTIDQPGHEEFWACCVCGHQYLEQPNGYFETRDDSLMVGAIDENHIAYIPPATSGGSNGDYWAEDPFGDD